MERTAGRRGWEEMVLTMPTYLGELLQGLPHECRWAERKTEHGPPPTLASHSRAAASTPSLGFLTYPGGQRLGRGCLLAHINTCGYLDFDLCQAHIRIYVYVCVHIPCIYPRLVLVCLSSVFVCVLLLLL